MRLPIAMLLGGLGLDWGIQLLELLILSDEFSDDRSRSASGFVASGLNRDLEVRDQGVGGVRIEVERQDLHGC